MLALLGDEEREVLEDLRHLVHLLVDLAEPRLALADDLLVRLDRLQPARLHLLRLRRAAAVGRRGRQRRLRRADADLHRHRPRRRRGGAGAGAVISATSEKRLSIALNSADSAASEARSDEPSASASNASRILRLVARARSRVSDDTASIRCAASASPSLLRQLGEDVGGLRDLLQVALDLLL